MVLVFIFVKIPTNSRQRSNECRPFVKIKRLERVIGVSSQLCVSVRIRKYLFEKRINLVRG